MGASVVFTNLDPFSHNVLGSNGAWGSFQEMTFDESSTYSFERAGVFPYVCKLHPGMTGAIVVGAAADGARGVAILRSSPATPIPASPAGAVSRRTPAAGPASSWDGWKLLAVSALLVVVVLGRLLVEQRRALTARSGT